MGVCAFRTGTSCCLLCELSCEPARGLGRVSGSMGVMGEGSGEVIREKMGFAGGCGWGKLDHRTEFDPTQRSSIFFPSVFCVLFGAMVYSCFLLQQVSVVKSVWRKWFLVLSREQSVFHAHGATSTAFMACNFSVSQMLRTYINLFKIHLQVHRFIKTPKLYLALGLTESFSHFPISLATTYISPRLRCGGFPSKICWFWTIETLSEGEK